MAQFHKQERTIRYYWDSDEWLGNRMLFLSGPRQVGKTTLATQTLCPDPQSYFNWDARETRVAYQKDPVFFSRAKPGWVCFDEIHKRPKWKDILKGIYDVHKSRYRFLITGSARLDTFKRSGDSLVGRYFHTHLFPLNLPDFAQTDFAPPTDPLVLIKDAAQTVEAKELADLLNYGGFPEPYFKADVGFWRRWSEQQRDLILQEDLRDLTRVVEIDKISHLLELLIPCVGQTVSNLNLSHDLETSHTSIKRWLEILAKIQLLFSVSPYSKNIRRSFKQEKKWYFMDWRVAEDNVFENYVAASLYRAVTLYNDRFGEKMGLHFVRTHDNAEVDFLLTRNNKPWLLIEAKTGKPDISRQVYYFARLLQVPCIVTTSKPNVYQEFKGSSGEKVFCISWSLFGGLLP